MKPHEALSEKKFAKKKLFLNFYSKENWEISELSWITKHKFEQDLMKALWLLRLLNLYLFILLIDMEVNYGNTWTAFMHLNNLVIMNCNTHGLLSKSWAKSFLAEKVQYTLLSNFTEGTLIVQSKTCGFIYKSHWVPRSLTEKRKFTLCTRLCGCRIFCNYMPPDILSPCKDISWNNCRTFFVN